MPVRIRTPKQYVLHLVYKVEIRDGSNPLRHFRDEFLGYRPPAKWGMLVLGAIAFVLGCNKTPESDPKKPAESFNMPAEGTTTALRSDLGEMLDLLRSGPAGAVRIRLRKMLDQNPTDGQAAFLYGLSLHQEKKYSEARIYFEHAREHAPEYATTHHFLGWCLFYEGELELANASFTRHSKLVEGEGDDHFALGLIALEQNDLSAAQTSFDIALQCFEAMSGGNAREQGKTLARLGELAEVQGNLDLAAERLSQATKLFPDHYEAWHRLAAIERRRGNSDAASRATEQEATARSRVGRPQGFPE